MQARPVINVEDFIGKTVGRRVPPAGAGLQKTLNQVMSGQQRGICPRGVYRFETHQDADAWMKRITHREKDAADLVFLRQQYPEVTGE